jgi:hypothetical protein
MSAFPELTRHRPTPEAAVAFPFRLSKESPTAFPDEVVRDEYGLKTSTPIDQHNLPRTDRRTAVRRGGAFAVRSNATLPC